MGSKENLILKPFFENPSREWHFAEILKEAKIARSKADGWLKKLIKDGLIKRVKQRGDEFLGDIALNKDLLFEEQFNDMSGLLLERNSNLQRRLSRRFKTSRLNVQILYLFIQK